KSKSTVEGCQNARQGSTSLCRRPSSTLAGCRFFKRFIVPMNLPGREDGKTEQLPARGGLSWRTLPSSPKSTPAQQETLTTTAGGSLCQRTRKAKAGRGRANCAKRLECVGLPALSNDPVLAKAGASSRTYSASKVIHRWLGEPGLAHPQPPVNNFGAAAIYAW